MGRKRQPADEPEEYEDAVEFTPAPVPEVSPRRAPDRTPAFLRFVPPADSSEGEGRAYSMPYTADRERWKRFIRGATDTTGIFTVEVRNRNQSIIGRDSIEVAPDHNAPATPTSPPPVASGPALPAGSLSNVVNEIDSTVAGLQRLNERISPQAQVTREDLETATRRAAEETARAIAAELKASQPQQTAPQKSLAELIREARETAEALGMGNQQQAPPPKQMTVVELLKAAREAREELRDELGPVGEDESGFTKTVRGIKAAADSIGSIVKEPMVLGTILRLLGAQSPTMQPPGAQPPQPPGAQPQGQQTQGQPQPAALPEPFAGVLRVLVQDCTRNAPPDRAADVLGSVIQSQPEYALTLAEWLSAPTLQLVELVASYGAAPWLKEMSTSVSWFDGLKAELSERSQSEQYEGDEDEAGDDDHQVTAAANNGVGHSGSVAIEQ